MCTGWWKIEPLPLPSGWPSPLTEPEAAFARLGWVGRGGKIDLCSSSKGTKGKGGLYAGYFDVIS